MPLLRTLRLLLPALACAFSACSHDTPRHDRPPLPDDGEGQRPGVTTPVDADSELEDSEWRVSGPAITLRYNRGGILFKLTGSGTGEIIDLDASSRMELTIPTPGSDSVCRGAEVTVNGRPIGIKRVKMLRHTDTTVWYTLLDTDSATHYIVLPAEMSHMNGPAR